jgi:muramoyltetrapeptide carboxypeptidase
MKKTSKRSSQKKEAHPIYPPPIKKGETIGLVSPASPLINKDNFSSGIQILEKKGFEVKFNRKLLNSKGYLAGSDQERADEFNKLWADPEVKALIAARGGYGCLRMIDLIDMKQIRKNPKILIGFSDLTVLLNAIHKKTSLVTFHGPVVTTLADIDKQSQISFFNVLTGKTQNLIKPSKVKILKKGKAKGILLGGNLTTLVHMIGTPYEIPWNNTILFIEDTGESPYRLDRLLTHLSKAKSLQKLKGLILGTFTDEERKENGAMQKAVRKRIVELFEGLDIPVWENFPVGHSRRNLTLPIGVEVKMNSSNTSKPFLTIIGT